MSKQLYDVYLINALLRKEQCIQEQIIHKLKAQRKSKSQIHAMHYEKEIVRLTKQLDDVYVILGKKDNQSTPK
jgi:hypothetical protein